MQRALILGLNLLFLFGCNASESNSTMFSEEPLQDTAELQIHEEEPYENEFYDSIANHTADSLKLHNAMDRIWDSPRVQRQDSIVQATTNGERNLTMILSEDEETEKFIVKIAEDNGSNYVTHLTFYITPSNDWEITYYDLLEDAFIELEEWNNQLE